MKNRKWLNYTLGTLLTLIVLAAVGGAGFRAGMMQNVSFARPAFTHDFETLPQALQGNIQGNSNPHAMQGDFRQQGFDNRGDDRRDGGMNFFSPIFGLIQLAALGLLGWFGYKFVQKSGSRITRETASAAPVAAETVSAEVEEEKPAE